MKVAVLLYQNIRHAPFLKFYEQIFQQIDGIDYDILYLDRHPELNEPNNEKYIPIRWVGKDDHNLLQKIITSLTYPIRVKRILNRKNYDFILVLTTMPGVLLANYLAQKYPQKYLVDIRDYTKENMKFYFHKERVLINNSAINIISSPDFTTFLPKAKYNLCHNFNLVDKKEYPQFEKSSKERLVISYVGNIQYIDYCMKLIKLVNEDDRYEFHFYGKDGGSMEVTNFIDYLNNPRIIMKGAFLPSQKAEIYKQSDLIFNCYGNENNIVKYAISNKFYDSAYYRRPLLVSPHTTMQRLTKNFAYTMDFSHLNDLNELYDWYWSIDKSSFECYCASVINSAIKDNEKVTAKIKEILVNAI